MGLKSISIPSFFYSLLWGFQVTVDVQHGMERLDLRTMYYVTSDHAIIQYLVTEKGNELFNTAH